MAGDSFYAAGSPSDPILYWLQGIRFLYDRYLDKPTDCRRMCIAELTVDIIDKYGVESRYRDDERFLKIFIINADMSGNSTKTFEELEKYNICQDRALLYECFGLFHIGQRNLVEANNFYNAGITRKAVPYENLKKIYIMFLKFVNQIATRTPPVKAGSPQLDDIDPYSMGIVQHLLKKTCMKNLSGYSLHENVNVLPYIQPNTIVQLGEESYMITEFLGKGGFGTVYKAHSVGNPDHIYALKVENVKPFVGPWEFYMYRQLYRIHPNKKSSFMSARGLYVYNDCNILVTDCFPHGSLWDVMHSYGPEGIPELISMYYTIEMLGILEVLHDVDLIHGDFKFDNLLVRYARGKLTEEGFKEKTGPWREQGLCLIDWGKGIDRRRFEKGTEFRGNSVARGFMCIEMQKDRSWTYQTDSYALCVNAHLMLHGMLNGVLMEVKIARNEGRRYYRPKSNLRECNILWSELFFSLININSNKSDVQLLRNLRENFQDYICRDSQRLRNLISMLEEGKPLLESWMQSPERIRLLHPIGCQSPQTPPVQSHS